MEIRNDVTHIYVVDRDGKKLWEGSCESTPEVIGEMVKKQAPDAVKIGLETSLCVPRLAVANSILTRVKNPSSLQALGFHIAKRSGMKKARIAVARTGRCVCSPERQNSGVDTIEFASLFATARPVTPARGRRRNGQTRKESIQILRHRVCAYRHHGNPLERPEIVSFCGHRPRIEICVYRAG